MKQRNLIGVIFSALALILLCGRFIASASEAPIGNQGGTALPVASHSSENTAAVVQITVSADRVAATTSPHSIPILVSAALNRAGSAAPDGTIVDFSISSGIGTLNGATTTVNGIATVRLASTTTGTVIVSATSGSVTAGISASFFAQPQLAIVKVATTGTLDSGVQIGSILASIVYPEGGYAITSDGVFPSGVAGNSTTTLAVNVETAGQVILALFNVNGITTGEFATLTLQVADGTLPSISDFVVTPAASVVAAVSNAALPGVSVALQSITFR